MHGNFILVGLPAYLQRHLQSVLNAAARLVFRLRRYDPITDALATLHWLRLPERGLHNNIYVILATLIISD